jgi:hypothetical protein
MANVALLKIPAMLKKILPTVCTPCLINKGESILLNNIEQGELIIHPLDDIPEQKVNTDIGRMQFNFRQKLLINGLKLYIIIMMILFFVRISLSL